MTDFSHIPWLSLLLALPVLAAVLCLLSARRPAAGRWFALAATLGVLGIAIALFRCLPAGGGWLRYEDHAWIPWLGIRYTVGVDGISLLLVLLTALLQLAAILIAWRREEHRALFFALLQFMAAGIIGVLISLDLILFYLFWEMMIIPMFFLLGIWGRPGERIYAAVKLFLFTLAGSLLMLLAILGLYFLHGAQSGVYTFSLAALQTTRVSAALAPWLFAAFMLSFAIKAPLVPLHTWLPDAHAEGPTDGSLDVAGLLVKVGIFAMLRIAFPLFPAMTRASLPLLAVLAFLGIFYSAWIAYAQRDIKRVVAYSSVAHVGFILLGLCAWDAVALEGSVLQLFNAGITTAALFLLVGMVQRRLRTRQIDELGGLWARAPILSAFFLFFSLAALGLPGLNNFAGEFLILIGTFRTQPLWGALAMAGVLFAAAYMLRLVQGVLWGPPAAEGDCPDLTLNEGLILVPLALLVLWFGIYPDPILARVHEPVHLLLSGTPLALLHGGMP